MKLLVEKCVVNYLSSSVVFNSIFCIFFTEKQKFLMHIFGDTPLCNRELIASTFYSQPHIFALDIRSSYLVFVLLLFSFFC